VELLVEEKPTGEFESYEDFKIALKRLYLDRKGKISKKSKKKETGEEASRVLCDIIIAVEDMKIFAWPNSSSQKLVVLTFSFQDKDSKEWIETIEDLAALYKSEGMLAPIRFDYVKERGKYLKGFVSSYDTFEYLLDRLYLKRRGRDNEVRCDIFVSAKERLIWIWPNKNTDNLIAVCWDAQKESELTWSYHIDRLKTLCDTEGIEFLKFNLFSPH